MDFGFAAAIFFVLSIIVGWIVAILNGIAYIIVFIRCIGKTQCKRDKCCLRNYCIRTACSDKEKDIIRKKIESLN